MVSTVSMRSSLVSNLVAVAAASTFFISVAEVAAADLSRIEPGVQKERDSARKKILLDELKSEQTKLTTEEADLLAATVAKKQPSVILDLQESVNRTKKNIEALNRELGMVGAVPKLASDASQPRVKTERSSADSASNAAQTSPWWDVYGRNRPK